MPQFLPLAKKEDIVIQELNDEVLIYDLLRNQAFCLNETSVIIWQMCDGTKTVAEISQAASQKFKAKISEDFVWLALDQFKKDELITNEFTSVFAGMTRREVIRKVGFASMVALPVVASIIAPTAVSAASCVTSNAGLPCTTSGQCCDNGLCIGSVCRCVCVNPGDCIASGCPSTINCNGLGQCAP
jgi:Coenzyme PQQ synthesis protein D (PqqD)